MNKSLLKYYLLLGSVMLLAVITILRITPLELILLNNSTVFNFFVRLFGLWAFVFIFFQILLGSGMYGNAKKFGSWIHKVHVTQGILTYFFIFFHPFTYFANLSYATKSFNPFYVYTDICILCKTSTQLYYSFGRVSFWLLTAIFVAAYFRTKPFFRRNWSIFHNLNYILFFVVGIHGFNVGSDIRTLPFVAFFVLSYLVVSVVIIKRLKWWWQDNVAFKLS